MARIRQNAISNGGRFDSSATALRLMAVLLFAMGLPTVSVAREPLSDGPVVWYATDDQPSEAPAFDEPALLPYTLRSFVARPFNRFWHPGRFIRRLGTGDAAGNAGDVNALDEVVNSTWFTNRKGFRELKADELRYGPGIGHAHRDGPDCSQPMTIIGAKTAGVTPGFRVRDVRGDTWLLKFDPPSHPGMTIRSGVVANLIFHAIGFNTPVDRAITFDRQDLVVGEGAQMKVGRVGKVPMTEANLDSILTATGSVFGGRYHALASRYLDGLPVGPFDDQDTRADDPNDLVKHENRRELRGLRVFAGWLNHFDTKMHNSLDMYEGEPGAGHVRHYLIDFASTLGAYGDQPVPRFGLEFGLDAGQILSRLVTLGAVEDTWVQVHRPAGLDEVGLFDLDTFEPERWKPDIPHSAIANLTERDGYWAAKIISAFTDDDLRILVEQGQYQNPAAAEFLIDTLAGRRDKIARFWFNEVPPLDHFRITGASVEFADLAVLRGYETASETSYRCRLSLVDRDRNHDQSTDWQYVDTNRVTYRPFLANHLNGPASVTDRYHFLAVEIQLNRGAGWSKTTTAYFSAVDGHIVAVDR